MLGHYPMLHIGLEGMNHNPNITPGLKSQPNINLGVTRIYDIYDRDTVYIVQCIKGIMCKGDHLCYIT